MQELRSLANNLPEVEQVLSIPSGPRVCLFNPVNQDSDQKILLCRIHEVLILAATMLRQVQFLRKQELLSATIHKRDRRLIAEVKILLLKSLTRAKPAFAVRDEGLFLQWRQLVNPLRVDGFTVRTLPPPNPHDPYSRERPVRT